LLNSGNALNLLTIFFIGIGLSMDAFAVGVSCGIIRTKIFLNYSLKIAFSFGFFQCFMVFLGSILGYNLLHIIKNYDHWVAFLILVFIGLKMIYESFKGENKTINPDNFKTLIFLSIATSIDAFAVGISLSLLKIEIFSPSIIIGITTFVLSFASVYLGCLFGKIFKKGAEILGGLILISIGIKILLEHIL